MAQIGMFENEISIQVQATPWDATSLGLKTYDLNIRDFDQSQMGNAKNVLDKITNVAEDSLFYSRINATSLKLKELLTSCGFYNCETQLHIYKSGLKKFAAPTELGSRRLPIIHAENDDYLEVASIAPQIFKFSRFHEDPFIAPEKADKRMELWCRDMHDKKTPLLISRDRNGKLDSFLYYIKAENDHIDLILGGSLPGKGMLTPLFWASFLEYFQQMGIKSIATKISASNIVIANIYMLFGFSLKGTYIDFHKLVNPIKS